MNFVILPFLLLPPLLDYKNIVIFLESNATITVTVRMHSPIHA